MPGIEEHPYLLLAEWSPRDHGLIMVQNYDIYFRPSPTSPHWYRITDTAVPGVISNGVPDWLYEGNFLIPTNYFIKILLYHVHYLQQMRNPYLYQGETIFLVQFINISKRIDSIFQ